MTAPLGIGKLDRERITVLLRGTRHTISVAETARLLALSRTHAAKLLARWALKGWITRIRQGVYILVPLESATTNIVLEDPWIIAERLYHPCYLGGWSAAEHWGLTEQIFRTVVIFTTQKQRNRKPTIKGTNFLLHTVSEQAMFGLQFIWHGDMKLFVSDPTRTILDFLIDPKVGGGLRPTIDMLNEYMKSKNKNLRLLIDYAKRLNNRAVFKRLGFLLEQYAPEELEIIAACQKELTVSKVKLDPQLDSNKLITRWHLWIPEKWSA